MESVSLHRRELYRMVWSEEPAQLCAIYDITERGLKAICYRLAVPVPEKAHWKKLQHGKKSDWLALPDRSKGTDKVIHCSHLFPMILKIVPRFDLFSFVFAYFSLFLVQFFTL